jgi:hypothetical protein
LVVGGDRSRATSIDITRDRIQKMSFAVCKAAPLFHDVKNPEPQRSLRDEGSSARLSAMAKRRAALPAATVMIDPK